MEAYFPTWREYFLLWPLQGKFTGHLNFPHGFLSILSLITVLITLTDHTGFSRIMKPSVPLKIWACGSTASRSSDSLITSFRETSMAVTTFTAQLLTAFGNTSSQVRYDSSYCVSSHAVISLIHLEYEVMRSPFLSVTGWLIMVQGCVSMAMIMSFSAQILSAITLMRWPLRFVLTYEWHLTKLCFLFNAIACKYPKIIFF